MHINDVGQNTLEEINEGEAGANYGWPVSEGPTSTPGQTAPIYWYGHGSRPQLGCAITGGAFYNPDLVQGWSPSNEFRWTPNNSDAGTHSFQVWVQGGGQLRRLMMRGHRLGPWTTG